MDFGLFILLNAVLFIRPEELYPEIAGLRIYLIVISITMLAAAPKILRQLSPDELERRPISVCVLGLLAAAALSLMARGRLDIVQDFIPEFAKVIIYYLVLVAVVDTPKRFRVFLGFQVLFISIVAMLGILRYFDYVDIEALKPFVQRGIDPETGKYVESLRLRASGIFNDPNDLCLILVFGSMCCLYQAEAVANRMLKFAWLIPIALFVYTLILTQSRGGLLGLMAGAGALVYAKFGWKRALPLVIVGAPAVVLAIGGRQAELSAAATESGHSRIVLWADGLSMMFSSPVYMITGIGATQYAR